MPPQIPTLKIHPPSKAISSVNHIYGGMAYKDEPFPMVSNRLYSPAGDIVFNTTEGTTDFKTSARYPTDLANMGRQLNHDWAEESPLDPHMHWWQSSADLPNALLAYRLIPKGGPKGSWVFLTWEDAGAFHEVTYTGTPIEQRSHWPHISMTGIKSLSCNVQFKLWRDFTNISLEFVGADPLAANWETIEFDYHYGLNKMGSQDMS